MFDDDLPDARMLTLYEAFRSMDVYEAEERAAVAAVAADVLAVDPTGPRSVLDYLRCSVPVDPDDQEDCMGVAIEIVEALDRRWTMPPRPGTQAP